MLASVAASQHTSLSQTYSSAVTGGVLRVSYPPKLDSEVELLSDVVSSLQLQVLALKHKILTICKSSNSNPTVCSFEGSTGQSEFY